MSSEAVSAPEPTVAPPPPRRRRRGRVLLIALLAVVVVLGLGTGGVGWYFSGVATEVSHEWEYPLTVLDVGDGTVTLPRDEATVRPGTWALAWKGGRALLGPVVKQDERSVVRNVAEVPQGTLTKGLAVHLDHWVYAGDPRRALGLEFRDVTYPTQVGAMPAWFLPGTTNRTTWVIAVHGRNADRAETFRAMPAVHRLGLPMLSIAYRNDVGAPRSPDHRNHLGDTEWRDVASAVAYARSQGATGVVLYGWSMGGAMVMTALRHSDDPGFVRGVVLDSPVMDWNATLDKQGAARNLPGFVTAAAKRILQWRTGIDLEDYDQRRYAPDLKTPTLLFTTDADATVDNAPSLAFAERAPRGMVTHVRAQGDHTEAWNVDPAAYERALHAFVTGLKP
ncbi:alpha/beta hydrolase family protein [Actinomadura keratinilytica]|uniref:Alpha/beta fold hydrolase n=1 Tax=Actinomadura keratinilytica TaxID=547461 RepID=A0ABP7YAL0_9ACTN